MRGSREDHAVAGSGRSPARARVGRERRVLGAALVLSALLHLLLIGVVGGLLETPRDGERSRPTPFIAEPPAGMRAVNVRAVAGEPTSAPVPPRPAEREEERIVMAPVDPAPEAEPAPADDRTAADRLAPRLVDPRLWRPIVLIPREPTLADVQARLDAAVELLSDSALAETERQLRATDWTVADASGGRWGISPGFLHLGKLKIPLPLEYAREYDPERDQFLEIEAQVDRTRFVESFEDRVRKIRERRDRERRERQQEQEGAVAGSGGGGF